MENRSLEFDPRGLRALKWSILSEHGRLRRIVNATSLTLQGISNPKGKLVQGGGASTFQQSCGNIAILVDGPYVTLSALCRTISGASNSTSLSLDNISNMNGVLSQ